MKNKITYTDEATLRGIQESMKILRESGVAFNSVLMEILDFKHFGK